MTADNYLDDMNPFTEDEGHNSEEEVEVEAESEKFTSIVNRETNEEVYGGSYADCVDELIAMINKEGAWMSNFNILPSKN